MNDILIAIIIGSITGFILGEFVGWHYHIWTVNEEARRLKDKEDTRRAEIALARLDEMIDKEAQKVDFMVDAMREINEKNGD